MKSPKVPYPYENKESMYKMVNHINDYDDIKSDLIIAHPQEPKEPVISIVMPVYDASYFKKALESALNQSFSLEYEIVVIDDRHVKWSDEIYELIKNINSPKVRLFRNSVNLGMMGNWNRCITLARAPYIVYLHADDMFVPDTLTILWDTHIRIKDIDSKAAIIGRFVTLGVDGRECFRYVPRSAGLIKSKEYYKVSRFGLLYGDSCNGCGALLNRSAMLELGGWNPDFHPGSDRVLFLQYADKFGLYRLNRIVRIETTAVSNSSVLYTKYPSISYYLSDAVIERYFHLKWPWRFFNYHYYLVYKNSKTEWDTDNKNIHAPLFSRVVTFLYTLPYRLFGGKRVSFSSSNNGY